MRRKLIGVITLYPEGIYQQRVLDGIFAQCEKYGYDVAVFASLMQAGNTFKVFFNGELEIYNIINFDMLDGVIVTPVPLSDNNTSTVINDISDMLARQCSKPVVAFDLPIPGCDAPTVVTDDTAAFFKIAEHMHKVHACKKVYFLAGPQDSEISHKRLGGVREYFKSVGIELPDENVFWGDFWYTSGENLAQQIAAGKVEKPEAVICASDHMAIGLANKLLELGVKVPDEVKVTGYDATAEAAISPMTITTYIPDIKLAAAKAVNTLHEVIEPDVPIIEAKSSDENGLRVCMSCGCKEDVAYVRERIAGNIFNVNINYGVKNIDDNIDISRLLDSYMLEDLTGSLDPANCLERIFFLDYLLRPYSDFYLCLNENWLTTDHASGYSNKMKLVMHTVSQSDPRKGSAIEFVSDEKAILFDRNIMLPQLTEEHDTPKVFYFTAVHFLEITLGYAVLECDLTQKKKIGLVYRNWIRNVNSALELARAHNTLATFSEIDAMTGLANRRGMERRVKKMLASKKPGDKAVVFVIDMDGLKRINDRFGHNEGDLGILEIARASREITLRGEVCVRAGGDEFYILGMGKYKEVELYERVKDFESILTATNDSLQKDYEISASIGWAVEEAEDIVNYESLIRRADESMYRSKIKRKKQRRE